MSDDLMEPRVAQVAEVLRDYAPIFEGDADEVARKIVEKLDAQAAKLAERGA